MLKSHELFINSSECELLSAAVHGSENRCKKDGEKMRIESIGTVISYYQKKYGLSLEQVCDGICSLSTLSRLEEGSRCADSLTSSLLLERIGKQVCQFELLLNDADYELWLARESILKHMQHNEYEQARQEIACYRKRKKISYGIHEQFCLCQEVLILQAEWKERKEKYHIQAEICETAMTALQLTKPAFVTEHQWKSGLYTTAETELILALVQYGGYQKTDIEVEYILSDLFHHLEYYDTDRRRQSLGNQLLMELIRLAQSLQDQDKVLAYIDKGINYVAQSREIAGLDRLRFLRAQALLMLYGTDARKDGVKKQEIQEECLMAYSICSVFGDWQQMHKIEQFCEEELEWQITKLGM